jgi:hypothetical protein
MIIRIERSVISLPVLTVLNAERNVPAITPVTINNPRKINPNMA